MSRLNRRGKILLAALGLIVASLLVCVTARGQVVDVLAMPAKHTGGDAIASGATILDYETKAAEYWTEVSYGRKTFRINVAPLYQIPYAYPGQCDPMAWNGDAVEAAMKMGFRWQYSHYWFVGCTSAEGQLLSYGTWISTPSSQVVAHEEGHNFGLNHANAWVSDFGPPLPPDHEGGRRVEYGSPWSVMGGGFSHISADEKIRLGFLPQTAIRPLSRIPEQDIALAPLELDPGAAPVAFSIERFQGGIYTFERRAPIGRDAGRYMGAGAWAVYLSNLEKPNVFVGDIMLGATWEDRVSGVRVSVALDGATAHVSTFDGPAPTPVPTADPRVTPVTPVVRTPISGPPACTFDIFHPCTPTPTAGTPTATPTITPTPTEAPCTLPPAYCPPTRTPAPPTATPTLTPTSPAPSATEPPAAAFTPTPTPTASAPAPVETVTTDTTPVPEATATPRPAPPPWTPPKPSKRGCASFSLSSLLLIAVGLAGWRTRIKEPRC